MSDIRITIACPVAHIADANHLARCIGYSAADGETFGETGYQDADGNLYAVASGLVEPAFLTDAQSPLVKPEWGSNMTGAKRAQALIVIGGPAAPGQITTVIHDDPQAALEELELIADTD